MLSQTAQRYFFDVDNGKHVYRDIDGLDLADRDAAGREAVLALPDMARDILTDADNRDLKISVRDRSGQIIFRATLSLVSEWIGDEATTAGLDG